MNDQTPYPLPEPTPFTVPFWDACQRQSLEIPLCLDCNHLFLPGGPVCPKCWSRELGSRVVSGRGTVFSYVIYHRTYHPSIPAPYVVAFIELNEGAKMVSNIIECTPASVFIGMRVQVTFIRISENGSGFMLPVFKPVGEG